MIDENELLTADLTGLAPEPPQDDAPRQDGKRIGRPPTWNEQVEDEVCEVVASGVMLNSLCKVRPDLPRPRTVLEYASKLPAFAQKLARARSISAYALIDQAIELTDTEPRRIGIDERMDSAEVQWRRNQSDLRKWLAGKFNSSVFGDKVEVEHTGVVQLQPDDVRAALVASQARRGRVIEVEPKQLPDAGA